MRVLVTGGAGYIGSIAVRRLRERGDEVVVLDSLERGHAAAIGDTPLVVGDIADRELVSSTVAEHGLEAAMHFAAWKAVDESLVEPGRYFANNVGGSIALLDALVASGVRRLVFSSSCAVYGSPARLPVDESCPLAPENPYGETKLLVERILRWYDECTGLRAASLRYFNAAGAWPDGSIGEDWTAAHNLVPVALRAAMLRRRPLQVFGTDHPTPDGTPIRDYIHVLDLVEAHLAALDLLARDDRSFAVNVGTGRGSSVLEVVAAIERVAGVTVPVELVGRRAGDPPAVWADPSLARELLGWEASRSLDEIVASAWRWHELHPNGYGPP